MTFNAASRLRSLEDRSAALGSSRCELPGMHSVPKSAVLPYASGVGGLSRRLLNLGYLGTWTRNRLAHHFDALMESAALAVHRPKSFNDHEGFAGEGFCFVVQAQRLKNQVSGVSGIFRVFRASLSGVA